MKIRLQSDQTSFMQKQIITIIFGIVLGLSITYFVFEQETETVFYPNYNLYILGSFIGVALSYFLFYSAKLLDNYVTFLQNTGLRFALGILGHFVICYSIVYAVVYTFSIPYQGIENFNVFYNDVLIKIAILIFITILLYEIFYFAFYSYSAYTTFQIESVKQKRKQIELQLSALKSQLSPHFLFNSLNSISSLIYKDVSTASLFIRRLAKLYQYTLDSYKVKLVSLEKELDFVNSYLFLVQTRFQDAFECHVELPGQIGQTKIPPLALQMLVENAVKHNLLDINNPLKIEIKKEGNYISVTNTINKKTSKVHSHKIGLDNINSRYKLIEGKEILIEKNDKFKVKIPIIS